MGYFSEFAIDNMEENLQSFKFNMEFKYNKRIEELEAHREYLYGELDCLDLVRPRDPLHPEYDMIFYSSFNCHYYENPHTVQDLLRAIDEVEDLLWTENFRTEQSRRDAMKKVQEKDLSQAIEGQMLMPEYWEGASVFKEAQQYVSILPVLSVCA